MSTTFQQSQTGPAGNFTGYVWSNAANWTNGVPANGGTVVFDQTGANNPSGYDDIGSLYLDNLQMTLGYLAVIGSLQIGTLTFGSALSQVYATTLPGNSSALLTIDGFAGVTGGEVEASGAGAVVNVLATSDPGEVYYATQGGEVELTALPSASSQLEFGPTAATIALRTAGTTITTALEFVAVGDAIALPGSSVSAVTFGGSSQGFYTIAITTNLGTTTFNRVYYSGAAPTGYTVSTDPTGLERITFTSATPTTFQQSQTGPAGNFTGYIWSNAANWTNGVPANGGTVVFDQTGANNPSGYDDIGSLYLDDLQMTLGYLAVIGSLQIGTLTFGSALSQVYATTLPGNSSALLTIDGFAGTTGGEVEASGAGAVVNVLATSDPGEVYYATQGGEVELTALPSASSQLEFGPTAATIALRTAGTTITTALEFVAVGDAIALPGSSVSAVTFGGSSQGFYTIAITTNLGTTTFNRVYYSGAAPTGYTVSTDPTGLERITFTSATPTTFQQNQTGPAGNFTGYVWSNAANWTNGVPANGGTVVFDQTGANNPSGYDDIGSLYLDNLQMTLGYLAVIGSLQIGTLTFGSALSQVYATTLPGNSSALLTIDGFAGTTGGEVEASGAGAVVNVLATSDPGEVYYATQGGEVELTALPSASSQLEFGPTAATIALRTAGTTITTALEFVAVGDAIALPGSSVSAVTFGGSSQGFYTIAITTNLGTTTFNRVYYGTDVPTYYTVSTDPTGLERVTFACYVEGTRISTPAGEIPVEHLAIGDEVFTASGKLRPVKWIGWRELDLRRYANQPDVHPIRIEAGSFNGRLPRRDLLLSPEHAVFVDGVLIPARCLVGCPGIRIDTSIEQLTYFHIELPEHDVILAEGLPCESWLDTGNRGMFQNAPVVSLAFSEHARAPTAESAWASHACARLVTDGPTLDAVRARLDAESVQSVAIDRVGAHDICVEPGIAALRLISPVGFASGDGRPLGVALMRIECDGECIALTDRRLAQGFHDAEPGWRWTSGVGVIELGASKQSRVVSIDVVLVAFSLAA
jgi:hypothetical protein